MTYYRVPPPPALRPFIESFSYWEGGERSNDRMMVTASRKLSLQIDLDDDRLCWYDPAGATHDLKGVTVAGPQSRSFAVDAWQPKIVRVVFESGGARPFLGASPRELRDTHISLEDVWGRDAGQLRQRLADANNPRAIFEILTVALRAAAAHRDCSIHPAVARALALVREDVDVTVTDLAERVEIGAKRLIRLFTDDVGLTPKLYLRIARFEQLIARVFREPRVDWVHVALEHGYYDQSHLIRDFNEFAGMSPAAYLLRRGQAAHHARV
jgi:AraC-like DNA-binding protein